MKKYFVLFTLLLIAVLSNAQESITDSLGCYESSSVKFCSYKEAYLKNDMAGVVRLDEFEVSYDKLGKAYTVYVRFDSIHEKLFRFQNGRRSCSNFNHRFNSTGMTKEENVIEDVVLKRKMYCKYCQFTLHLSNYLGPFQFLIHSTL